jgi:hypothetical protein
MTGEEKHWPPEGSAPRALLDLMDSVLASLTVLGLEGRTDGSFAYNCSALLADGREVEVEVS